MRAVHLRTEYLKKPLGIDIREPRFYWNCEDGLKQTAYRLVVKAGDELLMDSGKVNSDAMTHVPYVGRALKSGEHICWQVKLWDEEDSEGEWSESWFEMGLLEASDWKGKWISGDYKLKKNTRYPVDYFRKTFRTTKTVKTARLYITACGIYESYLNGKKIGDAVLVPGSTDYRKRLHYQTYDATELLQEENVLEIQLADGWYRGSIGCFAATNVFGRQSKVKCQLVVSYEDGSTACIASDETFAWSNDGPVRFADLKDGEVYNANMKPSYNGRAIVAKPPQTSDKKELIPVASNNVLPKEQEHFKAKLIVTPSGKKVLDFGQNIAGFVKFKVKGEEGQRVRLLCGEILDENGEFTQKNMQIQKPVKEFGGIKEMLVAVGQADKLRCEMQPTPKQEILFSCSGGEDVYQSHFTVFGFQYALIETDVDFKAEDFESIAVYSDMEQTGEFECSNIKVNQIFVNTKWSMKGNYLDVPTDCPTRERLAWTGDAQIFFNTAAYMMDVSSFFRKWMYDLVDNQFKNGKISAVAPYNGVSMVYDNTGTSVGWNDAAILIPYRYWKRYGDKRALEKFYPLMKKCAMFMIQNTGHKDRKQAKADPYNEYVYEKGVQLGEWLEPIDFMDSQAAGDITKSVHTEEATAYLHYSMKHMADAARTLGLEEDEKLFARYAIGAKKAYQNMFLKDGAPYTDRQAKLVRPLALGLADDEQRKALQERLCQAVENREYRISTGFLSTVFVLGELTRAGRADLAYKMLEQEKAPGWIYEINAGATTIWEDWEGNASHNHYSPGAVCPWMFDTIGGIRVGGENRLLVKPVPGGTLTYAKTSYQSPYGLVKSAWEKTETEVTFTVEIPANVTAEIVLPDGKRETVNAGAHEYKMKI